MKFFRRPMEGWRSIGDAGASPVFRMLSSIVVPVVCLLTGACTMVPAPEVKTIRNVVFSRPDWPKPMTAHVDLPEGNGPHPAVLLLHGGGLADSGGRWQMAGIAGRLARRGY